jgi:Icc-related predicted phosphoesterase
MSIPTRRKTRIVCISDTHNQTPKLPAGDVLIHAGDLTNQGSYSELKRTMQWLEKTDFEIKIIIAGNHDITLDEPFFEERESKWKWPEPQDTSECRRLVVEAQGITYLEHEAVTIRLKSGVYFKVFGSPFSLGRRGWAFQYQEPEAESLWSQIPQDSDIVVTHTPPKGHCDTLVHDGTAAGCIGLLQRLAEVQPVLSVCGHIHEGRGVKHVCWSCGTSTQWNDPGAGNKKISLVDLTGKRKEKAGREVTTLQSGIEQRTMIRDAQPDADDQNVTSSLRMCASSNAEVNSRTTRQCYHLQADLNSNEGGDPDTETAIINASVLGPKSGRSNGINKPIVVDIDLPILMA